MGAKPASQNTLESIFPAYQEFWATTLAFRTGFTKESPPRASHEEVVRAFMKAYEKEAASGNFEIFQSYPAGAILDTYRLWNEIVTSENFPRTLRFLWDEVSGPGSTKKKDATFEALFNLAECLNPSQVQLLWGWLKEDFIGEGRLEEFTENEFTIADNLRSILYLFFRIRGLSEELVSDLSLAFFSPLFKCTTLSLSIFRYGETQHNLEKLRFGASPFFVKGLNPLFYCEEVRRRGIDPDVTEILIRNWDGDFSSFLDAAESLSRDQS